MSKTGIDMNIAHNIDEKSNKKTSDVAIDESVDFGSMLLSETVLRGLKKAGFKRPSPIQLKAIPPARCGVDLIVQAKSGTGKTCVFVVIALETVVLENVGTQVLILAPTREIARQSYENLLAIGCCMPGLKCACFIGGTTLKNDKVASKHCHVVVGSPGRVCQLIQEGDLSIDGVRLFVLDEADKLMDDSYQENINWIFSRLPSNKQLLVLSATFPSQLDEFLTKYMKTPQMVKLDADDVQLVGIKQYVFTVTCSPGEDWLLKKIEGLHLLLSKATFSQCLIFCNFQDKAENLCSVLKKLDWPVEFIAAHLNQSQRLNVMKRLKKFQCRVLVSTDLTARGIDAEHVNLVINFDVPFNAETYLHRIGRAGRFGGYGAAITILCGWQTELSFYTMAAENNFRAKKLPDDFPLDVVANEPFFQNLPALEIPNLKSYERKAALKNARKNLPLQSEDFYGNLMKTYSYKLHRNDPQTYKFNSTLVETVENEEYKYDRDAFEKVLKEILGVKTKPAKKSKTKLPPEKRLVSSETESKGEENHMVNGHVEEKDTHKNSTEFIDTKSVYNKEVAVNGHVSSIVEEVSGDERVFTGQLDVKDETKEELKVKNEKRKSVQDVTFTNNDNLEVDHDDVREVGIIASVGDENKDVAALSVEKQFTASSPIKEEENVEPNVIENRPKMSYSDAFNASIDNHLCHLYGGFSWHHERAKILRQNVVQFKDQDCLTSDRDEKNSHREIQSSCRSHGESSNCSECWNEYGKVLQQYKTYMRCNHSMENGESFNKYADAWRKYERSVSRMATCLFQSQNVMKNYCDRMLSE